MHTYFAIPFLIFLPSSVLHASNLFDRQNSCDYAYLGDGVHFCNAESRWERTFAEHGARFSFYYRASQDVTYWASVFIEETSFSKDYNLDYAYDILKDGLDRAALENEGEFIEFSRDRISDFGGSLLVSYQITTNTGSIIASETVKLEDNLMIRLITYRESDKRHPGDYQLHDSFKRVIRLGSQ